MTTLVLDTPKLRLVLESSESALAQIEAMSAADRAQISPEWLARLRAAKVASPWTHGFAMVERDTGAGVGSCAFKGPPAPDGSVEIAYAVSPKYQGRGYAKEAAAALSAFALGNGHAQIVRAHTLPENNASTSVLKACGFTSVGEVIDPEDGPVWRWELVPPA